MEQKQESFEIQYLFGKDGEIIIHNKFVDYGYLILPVWQFESKCAPLLYGKKENYILPDMLIMKDTECAFIEAKRKRQYVNWNGIKETGICFRLYEQYMKIHNKTGIEVFVCFLHEQQEPTGLFLVNLCTTGRFWNGRNKDGIQFEKPLYLWNIKDLIAL